MFTARIWDQTFGQCLVLTLPLEQPCIVIHNTTCVGSHPYIYTIVLLSVAMLLTFHLLKSRLQPFSTAHIYSQFRTVAICALLTVPLKLGSHILYEIYCKLPVKVSNQASYIHNKHLQARLLLQAHGVRQYGVKLRLLLTSLVKKGTKRRLGGTIRWTW